VIVKDDLVKRRLVIIATYRFSQTPF